MNKKELIVLFDNIITQISLTKEISNKQYALLATIFPLILNPALEILDNGKIIKFICQDSKRSFIRVREPSTKIVNNTFGDLPKFGGCSVLTGVDE